MSGAVTGFGCGKVILFGEHAVVHGVPAIAVGLPLGVTTFARAASEDLLLIAPWGRVVRPEVGSDDPLSRGFAEMLAAYSNRPPLRLDSHVGLPPGSGLGCSAAIGVSILDAIDKALGIRRARMELGKRAFVWERLFHGAPSGIDNAAAAIGGLIRFDRAGGASTLRSPSTLHLVVAHSGQRANTKEMVSKVARRLRQRPDETRSQFEEVRGLVGEAECALLCGDTRALGEQLDRNHEVLRTLGLSTPRIESLRHEAKSAGALGAKVTGSGGGGCIVALAEDEHHAGSLARALPSDAFVAEVAHAA